MRTRIALAFLFVATLMRAQAPEQLIREFMNKWDIPGGSVCIAKDGQTVYNSAFGYADEDQKTPTRTASRYRIASVSKPITSMAIMKLSEEKRLSLDDKVFGKGRILDQFYYTAVIKDPRIYEITIRELLEHSAGWDRNVPTDGYSHNDPPFFPLHVTEEMGEANPVGDSTLIRFSLSRGLNFDPGKKFSYSNVGYLVLGKIIEKISGMSYEDYVQKNIFEPLNINDIALGKNRQSERMPDEVEYAAKGRVASCYGDNKKVPWQYGGFNLEAMNAHGGWIASAESLTRLASALNGNKNQENILAPNTIGEMKTADGPYKGYAKGWFVNSSGNIWHTGSLDGSAAFICATADGYTWAFLFNARGDNSADFWSDLDRLPWNCLQSLSTSDALAEAPDHK